MKNVICNTRLYTNKYLRKSEVIKALKYELKVYKDKLKEYKQFNKPKLDSSIVASSIGYINAIECTIKNLKNFPCDEVEEVIFVQNRKGDMQ